MERLFFLLVRLVTVLLAVSSADGGNRRILHPIFPDDSAPQNKLVPPPPADADQDEPFFPEESSLGNQTPTNGSVAIPTATKPTKPSNKPTVIAASVGIGVLSSAAALLYLIHRHKAKKQKPLEDPHSSFLYIPHNKTSVPSTPPPYFHPEIESSLPRRPKFRAPPPPPNLALLQSLTNPRHHIPKLSPTASTPAELPPKVRTTWTSYIKTPTSFQLNEDPMANNSYKSLTTTPSLQNNNIILDPKRSQNVAILARALNVTLDEVSQTLFDGDSEALGAETLEALMKMAPNKEEEIKLKAYKGDTSKLGSADKFLKAIVDIPFAFRRVEAMIYRENFDAEIEYLRKSFETLEEASSELMNSRLFLKLLQTVLTTGNRMNAGTNRGGAKGFRLDTLLKLVDIKGADGKTTLLHFVVQEIIRSQDTDDLGSQRNSRDKEVEFTRQGLIVVARLNRELGKVKLAAGMNSDALRSNVSKLETGLHKLKTILQYERSEMKGNFLESMQAFVKKAEEEICRIKKIERKALTLVREVAEYFHGGGDAVEEEAHSLRIFIIVRDFISTLDHVCKDVGTMQESTVMGADRSFRISLLPVLGRYNAIKDDSSSEGSSSP